jgi:signal transduction histidine kinase
VPVISADRDRLMQVMLNLLSNAAKFCRTDGSGRVRIALRRLPDALQVDVADNGIGISEADQKVIFEKFRQVGDTLTAKPQGSGLGLPICRQIIGHFGGKLWVRSRPGAGATFSFTIPIAESRAGQQDAERAVGSA